MAVYASVLAFFYWTKLYPETPRFREGGGASIEALSSLRIFCFIGEMRDRQKSMEVDHEDKTGIGTGAVRD